MEQSQKDAIKVQVLTQRVSQLVAQYEDSNADLQAQAQLLINELEAENTRLKERIAELEGTDESVAEAPEDAEQG